MGYDLVEFVSDEFVPFLRGLVKKLDINDKLGDNGEAEDDLIEQSFRDFFYKHSLIGPQTRMRDIEWIAWLTRAMVQGESWHDAMEKIVDIYILTNNFHCGAELKALVYKRDNKIVTIQPEELNRDGETD